MNNAVGYVRVSTEGQVKEGVSLENQEEKIRAYCGFKGFDLVDIIRDEGISGGKNAARPGFLKLLEGIEEDEIQILVLYSLERLSRDMLTLLALERLLDEYDIQLHTVEGMIDTSTPDGFMNFAMKAFLGEMERRQVKYRTKKALEYKKSQGQVTGRVPYGFSREGKNLVENPDEQMVIAIVNKFYEEEKGLTEICRELKNLGHKTRKGKDFVPMQVKRMIEDYKDVRKDKKNKLACHIKDFITSIA